MGTCGVAREATGDNIILRMRFACWINKTTDTHSERCNTYCFSTATMVTRLSVVLFVRYLSCLLKMTHKHSEDWNILWGTSCVVYFNAFMTLYLCINSCQLVNLSLLISIDRNVLNIY